MPKLSDHFSRSEFECSCGCGFDTVDPETLTLAEEVRAFEGGPVTVNSGCRCLTYNRSIGSSDGSQHPKGRAADLAVKDPKATYKHLDEKYPGKYGFGLYDTFVHVDSRSGPGARWAG